MVHASLFFRLSYHHTFSHRLRPYAFTISVQNTNDLSIRFDSTERFCTPGPKPREGERAGPGINKAGNRGPERDADATRQEPNPLPVSRRELSRAARLGCSDQVPPSVIPSLCGWAPRASASHPLRPTRPGPHLAAPTATGRGACVLLVAT
jgi:hypothetical protein